MFFYIDCTTFSNWSGFHTGIQRVIYEIGIRLRNSEIKAKPILWESNGLCYEFDLEKHNKTKKMKIEENCVILAGGSDWDNPDHHKLLIEYKNKGAQIVPIFYDIIPLILPHSYGPGFSHIYENWLIKTLQISDFAFAISENTKRDIYKYAKDKSYNCPDIYTVRLGEEINSTNQNPSFGVKEKASEPYLLTVSTIEYRKNHIFLLNLYRYIIEYLNFAPPKLIIVGKQGWADQNIVNQIENDNLLRDYITVMNGISDGDLEYLYRNCQFTLFPSFYEGWGLPVAESLFYKKPCIASNTSSMPEIAPNLVEYLDPLDMDGWINAIIKLNNTDKLNKKIKQIEEEYKITKWDSTAESIIDLLTDRYPNQKEK